MLGIGVMRIQKMNKDGVKKVQKVSTTNFKAVRANPSN